MPHHKQEGDDGQEDDSEEDALTRLMSLIITSTCKWQTCVRALKQVLIAPLFGFTFVPLMLHLGS